MFFIDDLGSFHISRGSTPLVSLTSVFLHAADTRRVRPSARPSQSAGEEIPGGAAGGAPGRAGQRRTGAAQELRRLPGQGGLYGAQHPALREGGRGCEL